MAVEQKKGLWGLVWGRPQVDPAELAEAMANEIGNGEPDFRTRLLIRDSLQALQEYWGRERVAAWLLASPARAALERIWQEDLGEPGFPSLAERIMEKIDPEVVRQFLRDLGTQVPRPVRLTVGGVIALILPGYVTRATEDIDVVDEVPAEVRSLRPLLEQLRKRYGLQVTHFQSHYLPARWHERLHSAGPFGQLHVFLVDVYDVFLSKLSSAREKDRDDLRLVAPQLSKDVLVRRLRETAGALLADAGLRQRAESNWYILFGEPLPSTPDSGMRSGV